MRSSNTEDTLSRRELRTLQRTLRTRASNLRKKAKRHGLIRPLSQIDTGCSRLNMPCMQSQVWYGALCVIADFEPFAFGSPVTYLRNGEKLDKPCVYLFDPEVQ